MKTIPLGISLVSLLLLAAPAFSAEAKTQRGAEPSVSFRDGLLTVEANGRVLGDVLAEIRKKSGITFTMRKTLPDDTVTASFRDVPIETAIRRLVERDFDLVWFYTPPRFGRGAPVPSEVWVVGRGERAGAVAAARGAAPRSPKPAAAPLPPLFAALSDADPQVRAAAAEALGESGSPEAVPVLRAGLRDADSEVREAVVEALGSIAGPEAEGALRLALADRDEDVREAASDALAILRRKKK